MAAYDSDIEDFDIEEETILELIILNQITLIYTQLIHRCFMMQNCQISFFMAKATFQKLLVGQTINTVRTWEKNIRKESFWTNTNFYVNK